ncbi:unnamed protein product [Cylindrotheca closterium]|nr:unnamed protein product [Cylindrotheca closterium]
MEVWMHWVQKLCDSLVKVEEAQCPFRVWTKALDPVGLTIRPCVGVQPSPFAVIEIHPLLLQHRIQKVVDLLKLLRRNNPQGANLTLFIQDCKDRFATFQSIVLQSLKGSNPERI